MKCKFGDVDELHQRLRRCFGICFVFTVLLSVLLVDSGILWHEAARWARLTILLVLGCLLIVTSWHWLRLRDANQEVTQGLSNLLFVDYLTKIFNSRYLDERLEHELRRARRRGRPLSVLYLDLDRFKEINDTLGHHAGDDVLEQFGRLLRQCVRDCDVVGRLGGDEFLIILPDTATANARKLAIRVKGVTASHSFMYAGRSLPVSLSIGVASFPADATDKDQLLILADEAMYAAKKASRRRTHRPDANGPTQTQRGRGDVGALAV